MRKQMLKTGKQRAFLLAETTEMRKQTGKMSKQIATLLIQSVGESQRSPCTLLHKLQMFCWCQARKTQTIRRVTSNTTIAVLKLHDISWQIEQVLWALLHSECRGGLYGVSNSTRVRARSESENMRKDSSYPA